jgi:hypothetical protein
MTKIAAALIAATFSLGAFAADAAAPAASAAASAPAKGKAHSSKQHKAKSSKKAGQRRLGGLIAHRDLPDEPGSGRVYFLGASRSSSRRKPGSTRVNERPRGSRRSPG